MLVVTTLRGAALEVAKCRHEESRLPHQPLGAAVVRSARFEHTQSAPLEVIDAVLPPLELVVETKNLGDETWTQLEWWHCALFMCDSTRSSQKHFSLSRREHRADVAEPFTQTGNELTRGDEIGKGQRMRGCAEHGVFDRPNQQRGSGARRHDDHAIAGINRRAQCREPDDRLTKCLKIGDADEASTARSWMALGSSLWALARVAQIVRSWFAVSNHSLQATS